MAGRVYDLVLPWDAARVRHGHTSDWPVRPRYRSQTTPSCLDMLTAVRQDSWRLRRSSLPSPAPVAQNPPILAAPPWQATA